MRVIEETDGSGTPSVERQYVFGNGIDEALVLYDKNGESYDVCHCLLDPMSIARFARVLDAFHLPQYNAGVGSILWRGVREAEGARKPSR